MPINQVRYFVHQVLISSDVDCSWNEGSRERKSDSPIKTEFLVPNRPPQVCKGIMTGVFIGFEAGRNSVKRVKDKISDPVGKSREKGNLNFVVIDEYLCDDGSFQEFWVTISLSEREYKDCD